MISSKSIWRLIHQVIKYTLVLDGMKTKIPKGCIIDNIIPMNLRMLKKFLRNLLPLIHTRSKKDSQEVWILVVSEDFSLICSKQRRRMNLAKIVLKKQLVSSRVLLKQSLRRLMHNTLKLKKNICKDCSSCQHNGLNYKGILQK